MTVKELCEALAALPNQDAKVFAGDDTGEYEITAIRPINPPWQEGYLVE